MNVRRDGTHRKCVVRLSLFLISSHFPPQFFTRRAASQRALDSYSRAARALSGIEKSYRTTGRTSESEIEGEERNRHEGDGLEN